MGYDPGEIFLSLLLFFSCGWIFGAALGTDDPPLLDFPPSWFLRADSGHAESSLIRVSFSESPPLFFLSASAASWRGFMRILGPHLLFRLRQFAQPMGKL